jgi:RNA-splicing ligase RtcB
MYSEILDIVKNGKKYRSDDWNKEMPECVRNETTFTVFRAGEESIDDAAESMSWTLWRDVAEWFAERHEHYGQGTQHLYKATISADDVIAFTNERQEFEIIQYRGVKDIEEIPRAGVSAEYKEIFATTTYNLEEIEEKSSLAVELFSRWYQQNKNGEA